ncbi:MAG: hypothetical protein JXR25_16615 [Pontiellaceae bacterium]|nr:hypothetical protein [Pontiellaceae bacterium]MBN2786445.1 hypothetical protein [Pontiellaceae bacterium]
MDKDIMDRLLMDRALGVLDPDVEALLEYYLARHPDAADCDRKTAELVSLSREVLRADGEREALPACPSVPRRRMVLLQPLGIAAALAVCFLIGQQFAAVPPSGEVASTAVPVSSRMDDVIAPSTGIWSLRREAAPARRTERLTRWKWASPVRQPKVCKQGDEL